MTIRAGGRAIQARAIPGFLFLILCPISGVTRIVEGLAQESSAVPRLARTRGLPVTGRTSSVLVNLK